MLPFMYSARRLTAVVAAVICTAQLSAPIAIAKSLPASTLEEVAFTQDIVSSVSSADENLLAHHGGEGSEAVGVVGAASAASAAGVLTGHASRKSYSDSLWGNMLLNMAFARDEELQHFGRRLGQINALTMMTVMGVSGLGLAQNIYAHNHTSEPVTVDVTPAHHPGGEDHVHIPGEKPNKIPTTMGIIGSGVTLGALGVRAVAGKAYTTKIVNRQTKIRDHVDSILDRLEQGVPGEAVQGELVSLVGQRASSEFLLLWKAVHPGF